MSSKAASRTVRARGPTWASVGVAAAGKIGTRPKCALMPKRPQNDDGIRIDPPPSVPSANGISPAATLAAAPAEEPPVVLARSHGFRVSPVSGLLLDPLQPNSVVVVLPMIAAPCAFTRSDAGESTGAMKLASVRDPDVKRTPLTAVRSLTDNGSPVSRPVFSPDMTAFSAVRAASIASSGVMVTKALSDGCEASTCRSVLSTISTGDACFLRIRRPISMAVMKEKSLFARGSTTPSGRETAASPRLPMDCSIVINRPCQSSMATARTGEPLPLQMFSGKPLNSNSPLPTSASRLQSHS